MEAFNSDDFSKLSFADFETVGLFEKLGFSLQNENIYDAVSELSEHSSILNVVNLSSGNNPHFARIS